MNLTAARLDRGLSPTDAATRIGISRATLRKAERGEMVHPSKAKLIADFYGVKVTDLWPVDEPNGVAA